MTTRTTRRVAVRRIRDRLETGLWFGPLVMSFGAVLLAWAMYWIDSCVPYEVLHSSRFVLSGTAVELRSGLLNMATTVLATAGVVFTLLTIPLSTVAAQYGSRLLRIVLRDRTTQFVLAMFSATFVYCIAGAMTIPHSGVERVVPQLTATVGLFLMLATFASLIVLVQHVSTTLQAPKIAAAAGRELVDVVSTEIPDNFTNGNNGASEGASETDLSGRPAVTDTEGYPVRVRGTGYIQTVDPDTILGLAQEKNLVIRLLHKPGHFARSGATVALVWPADQVDIQLAEQLCRAFKLGYVRTPTQDIEYAVNQLTEMAMRAMSAAINDPYTAMTCLDHIGNGLAVFIHQRQKDTRFYDRAGTLRLISEPVTLDELLSAGFDMLRHASSDNADVLLHMLEVLDRIDREATTAEQHSILAHHMSLIGAESQSGDLIEEDRAQIRIRAEEMILRLRGMPSSTELKRTR